MCLELIEFPGVTREKMGLKGAECFIKDKKLNLKYLQELLPSLVLYRESPKHEVLVHSHPPPTTAAITFC